MFKDVALGCVSLFLLVPAPASCEETRAELSSAQVQVVRSQGRTIARSRNFEIISTVSHLDLRQLAKECEQHRSRLLEDWLNADADIAWSPRCVIEVHRDRSLYGAVLGAGAGSSVGCTTIRVRSGRIAERRIDLRADADQWQHDALPHELTHVVLADRFGNRPLPLWADEGMGVLAESERKQEIRSSAARDVERRSRDVSVAELLYDSSLPGSSRRDAFYSRSAELVNFLVSRHDGATFVNFLDDVKRRGYELALRDHYDIPNVGQLQRLWSEREVVAFE